MRGCWPDASINVASNERHRYRSPQQPPSPCRPRCGGSPPIHRRTASPPPIIHLTVAPRDRPPAHQPPQPACPPHPTHSHLSVPAIAYRPSPITKPRRPRPPAALARPPPCPPPRRRPSRSRLLSPTAPTSTPVAPQPVLETTLSELVHHDHDRRLRRITGGGGGWRRPPFPFVVPRSKLVPEPCRR